MVKNLFFILLILVSACNTAQDKKEVLSEKDNAKDTNPTFNLVGESLPNEVERPLDFQVIQKVEFDFNNDKNIDTLIIEKISKWTSSSNNKVYDWTDPGDFHRIRLSIAGHKTWTLVNVSGWVNKSSLLKNDKSLGDESLFKSDYVLVRKESNNNFLLFAAGYAYASNPGLLTIINIYKGEEPKLVFNENVELYGLKDIDDNGIKDLITSGNYEKPEENKYKHKVYLLNGGFLYNQEYTKQLYEELAAQKP